VAILFAGSILGLVLAAWFYATVGAFFEPYVSSPALAKFIGFLLVFAGVQLVANLISWLVGKVFKVSGLSWLDRLLGAAFGLLRAFVISTILLLALMAFPFRPVAETVSRSQIAPYVIGIANVLAALAPKELKDGFHETYERVKQLWENPSGTPPPPRGSA
jgi:membrane protein required for colicin V production